MATKTLWGKRFVVLVVFSFLSLMVTACQKTVTGKVIFEEIDPYITEPKHETSNRKGPPPWAPAHGYRAKYKYLYYPSSSVYYDSKRKAYFYRHRDSWLASTDLPRWIKIDKDDYVTLEMNTDRPYEFHSDVQKKYPPGQQKIKKKNKGKGKKDKGKKKEKYK